MYEKCSSISTKFSAQNTWKVKLHGAIAMNQCNESLRMTKLTQNTKKQYPQKNKIKVQINQDCC